eukprot:GHVU01213312.1.p1 GENE.GHVU01213312.1~~GHVU01213312.1.p1  ORF type:complete len:134 (+),score=6.15 GHVU01213312.1:357-758(+)
MAGALSASRAHTGARTGLSCIQCALACTKQTEGAIHQMGAGLREAQTTAKAGTLEGEYLKSARETQKGLASSKVFKTLGLCLRGRRESARGGGVARPGVIDACVRARGVTARCTARDDGARRLTLKNVIRVQY